MVHTYLNDVFDSKKINEVIDNEETIIEEGNFIKKTQENITDLKMFLQDNNLPDHFE